MSLAPPPIRTDFIVVKPHGGGHSPQWPWTRWFQSIQEFSNAPVSSAAPVAANAPGTQGQIAFTNDHIYVCVKKDTWKRASLGSF
jgi:hypothetical protein